MHIRIEAPYIPLVPGQFTPFFSSMSIKAQERLHLLTREAASIPRVTGFYQPESTVATSSGKYLFLCFDQEDDLPIAKVECIIINVREESDWSYGLIQDLVVLPEYRRHGVARSLIGDLVRRMSEPDVLQASLNRKLSYLLVAISSHLIACRKIFEAAGFVLVHGNGESLYELKLESSED